MWLVFDFIVQLVQSVSNSTKSPQLHVLICSLGHRCRRCPRPPLPILDRLWELTVMGGEDSFGEITGCSLPATPLNPNPNPNPHQNSDTTQTQILSFRTSPGLGKPVSLFASWCLLSWLMTSWVSGCSIQTPKRSKCQGERTLEGHKTVAWRVAAHW